jgi:hypothetical protein
MKKITLHIHAEMEIPDHWKIIDDGHGLQRLKIGDKFVDFDIAPLSASTNEEDTVWTDEDEELTAQVLDTVTGMDATLELDVN